MPAKGGAATLVTPDGTSPQFAGDDKRLYVIRSNGEAEEGGAPPRKLVSMNYDGGHVRDVAGARFPTAISISPDGTHVAFIENYHLYVTPVPRTGKLINLDAELKSLPGKRLSAIGATFVHWVDDQTVAWSIGPEYKSVTLAAVYQEDFEPVSAGLDLSILAEADRPQGVIALTNARIVTMAETGVIENGIVVVEGNRIVDVGADATIPEGAAVIDLHGQTVVPGFIDAHAHGAYAQDLIVPQQNWSAYGHLALGVTTVHDPSNRATSVFAAAEYARAGYILAPRTFSTGNVVYGAKSYGWASIDSLEDALAHVRRLKAQGAISVKNYNQPRREQRQQVTEASRLENMMVVSEGGALFHMDLNMVADGNTGIEHSLPQLAIYDDVVQFWSQTNVGYTPTLVVGYGTIEGENYWYQHDEVWKHPILSQYVPPRLLQARSVRRTKAPESDYRHADNAAIGKQLADAGVLVHTGAHGQREGLATHWELWMFVQGGMTPLEALRAATIAPAQYLGFDRDLGSLEPGKLADLVVIDGDVTRDIRVSDRVTSVMLNGRLFDASTLKERLTGDHTPKPFYWVDRPESKIR
jgi:imidazolonepropionase-like amidohydrolase